MVYGKSALQEQSVAAETDLLFKHTQLALVRPPAAVKQYRDCRPSEKASRWGFDALNTPTHCRSQRGPQYLIRELLLSHYVSKASADLMHYCSEHAKYDPLLMGIPASENPFKDKKPCTIL
ncbi:Guanine nucleotide-binding protein G(I)/G(S)/G(O) subunit gamma-12 [Anabarilius grahami]|uniref:Guanine nucleotide-binding protein subunit gamma n=1 Tax=Anabarilius grahami TaxID=495550 RepID=A0A3N0XEF4_ANAGA|nr:Guanine nucleotide-binding protein G(I)/G(S)/G(O) subunit gamma-12 [Anabarilius grahami]